MTEADVAHGGNFSSRVKLVSLKCNPLRKSERLGRWAYPDQRWNIFKSSKQIPALQGKSEDFHNLQGGLPSKKGKCATVVRVLQTLASTIERIGCIPIFWYSRAGGTWEEAYPWMGPSQFFRCLAFAIAPALACCTLIWHLAAILEGEGGFGFDGEEGKGEGIRMNIRMNEVTNLRCFEWHNCPGRRAAWKDWHFVEGRDWREISL